MNTLAISFSEEKTVQLYNDEYSNKYRLYDEHFVTTADFQQYAKAFGDICQSFNRKIDVLDIGCGSGRYFHVLKNVAHLTGIDVAEGMIKAAHNPVNAEQMDIEQMDLMVGNIYTKDFNRQYDFIYSVGVLGGHAPLTPDLCSRIHKMLSKDGIFYVTVVDLDSRKNMKRKVAEALYPVMPTKVQKMFDKRWETNYLTQKDLEQLIKDAGFSRYELKKFKTTDKGWQGVQMEATCYA